MSAATLTYNIGNDPTGRPLFLRRECGQWKLQLAGDESGINVSEEQIRMIADLAGVAKAASR